MRRGSWGIWLGFFIFIIIIMLIFAALRWHRFFWFW